MSLLSVFDEFGCEREVHLTPAALNRRGQHLAEHFFGVCLAVNAHKSPALRKPFRKVIHREAIVQSADYLAVKFDVCARLIRMIPQFIGHTLMNKQNFASLSFNHITKIMILQEGASNFRIDNVSRH